jgi:hypothetical protein
MKNYFIRILGLIVAVLDLLAGCSYDQQYNDRNYCSAQAAVPRAISAPPAESFPQPAVALPVKNTATDCYLLRNNLLDFQPDFGYITTDNSPGQPFDGYLKKELRKDLLKHFKLDWLIIPDTLSIYEKTNIKTELKFIVPRLTDWTSQADANIAINLSFSVKF